MERDTPLIKPTKVEEGYEMLSAIQSGIELREAS
jgi:hypothetical protein